MPPDCCDYLTNSLYWSAIWLVLGYVAMTAYITKGRL